MYAKKAIEIANNLRPNALGEEQKYQWLLELDAKVADMMEQLPQELKFPKDFELFMPFPYDNIYQLYLVAQIDYYNQETALYSNDMTMFNAAWDEATAWWRRNMRQREFGNWRIM